MNTMIITFKKIKNKDNEYIIIFNSNEFLDNIIMFFTLDLYSLKAIINFINMLQNYYKICDFDIEIYNNDAVELSHELELLIKHCPF